MCQLLTKLKWPDMQPLDCVAVGLSCLESASWALQAANSRSRPPSTALHCNLAMFELARTSWSMSQMYTVRRTFSSKLRCAAAFLRLPGWLRLPRLLPGEPLGPLPWAPPLRPLLY